MDRVRARTLLDAAYEEGQLGAGEYHDRSDRAEAAETIGELRGLVADLQTPAGVAGWSEPPGPDPAQRSGRYPGRIRARNADRDRTCKALDTASADGQLSAGEYETRTDLAAAAVTLGDLAGLTDDLQKPAPSPIDPRSRLRRRVVRFAGVLAVVAALAGVGGFRLTHRSAPPAPVTAPAGPSVQPVVVETPDLTTAAGFEKFRRDYRAKFGDTVVDELSLSPNRASVDRTSTTQPNRVAGYEYRGGFMASSAPTTRSATAPIFDLATVDSSALADLLTRCVALVKVDGGAVSHLRMAFDDSTKMPTIDIFVENGFDERGYVEATPAGHIIRVSPFGG